MSKCVTSSLWVLPAALNHHSHVSACPKKQEQMEPGNSMCHKSWFSTERLSCPSKHQIHSIFLTASFRVHQSIVQHLSMSTQRAQTASFHVFSNSAQQHPTMSIKTALSQHPAMSTQTRLRQHLWIPAINQILTLGSDQACIQNFYWCLLGAGSWWSRCTHFRGCGSWPN